MGDYIRSHVEVKDTDSGEWVHTLEDILCQSYDMYAFLLGYQPRNYACVPMSIIPEPNGLPEDVSAWTKSNAYRDVHCGCCGFAGCNNEEHSQEPEGWAYSHISLDKLLAFDYDSTLEYRRNCRSGERGKIISYRDMLGTHYFDFLDQMKALPAEASNIRLITWLY